MKTILSIAVVLSFVVFSLHWNFRQNRWPKPMGQYNVTRVSYESETFQNPLQIDLPHQVAGKINKTKHKPIEIIDDGVDGLLLQFSLIVDEEGVEEVAIDACISKSSSGHDIVLESSLDYFPVINREVTVCIPLKLPSRSGNYEVGMFATYFGPSEDGSQDRTEQLGRATLRLLPQGAE